jgi:hypothetical protein
MKKTWLITVSSWCRGFERWGVGCGSGAGGGWVAEPDELVEEAADVDEEADVGEDGEDGWNAGDEFERLGLDLEREREEAG